MSFGAPQTLFPCAGFPIPDCSAHAPLPAHYAGCRIIVAGIADWVQRPRVGTSACLLHNSFGCEWSSLNSIPPNFPRTLSAPLPTPTLPSPFCTSYSTDLEVIPLCAGGTFWWRCGLRSWPGPARRNREGPIPRLLLGFRRRRRNWRWPAYKKERHRGERSGR
jgi:hypothetical protein